MTFTEGVYILMAGFGAGILTSTVGVASLASFPVLLALGIPPVVANTSNAVGLTPAGLSGSWGYRKELREQPRVARLIIVTCASGAGGGAALLLALQPGVFEHVAPWLILATCLLVGAQPCITRTMRQDPTDRSARTIPGPITTALSVLTGVYGGYFGAGSGVMMVAVLGFGLDLELRVVNALKTLAIAAANVVASLVFVFAADLNWQVVGILAIGSIVGGYVGSRVGRRVPPALMRALIVVAGIVAAMALA
jgi:uncharacterized membrane protein YfcA